MRRNGLSRREDSILDVLQQRVGADYMSDLRLPQYRRAALRELLRLPAEAYPEALWCDAVLYLTEGMKMPGTREQAMREAKEMLEWLHANDK